MASPSLPTSPADSGRVAVTTDDGPETDGLTAREWLETSGEPVALRDEAAEWTVADLFDRSDYLGDDEARGALSSRGAAAAGLLILGGMVAVGVAFVFGFGSVFALPADPTGNPIAHGAAAVVWAGSVGAFAAMATLAAYLLLVGAGWFLMRRTSS